MGHQQRRNGEAQVKDSVPSDRIMLLSMAGSIAAQLADELPEDAAQRAVAIARAILAEVDRDEDKR